MAHKDNMYWKPAKGKDETPFSRRLRQCRVEKGMTQKQLAQMASVHRTYISGIENGKRNPSLHTVGCLARAMGLELWQLLLDNQLSGQGREQKYPESGGKETNGEKILKRVKLIVAYDGTAYCGWQIQKNGITIEEILNLHLSQLLGEEIQIIGASRTDAGVHALGNVAVFDTQTRIPGDKIAYALNQRLPEDVRIQGSEEVSLDFHPRYCNSTKTYEYRIFNGPFEMPVYRNNTYFFHRKLDIAKMQQAAGYFLGEHDFAAFCSAHAQVKETTRTIYDLQVHAQEENSGQLIRIRISGNGFLYNMVRIVAGTLLEVGLGKYPPERVKEIIDIGKRELSGPCAPARGLTLLGIDYEEQLADELHVFNERMHYSLVQKEIPTKQEACLTVFWCQEELLEDLIVRMTKKAFRLGAKKLYVRHKETPLLSQVLVPSKHNSGKGDFFTAGDFRYVLDHEIWQMDRDLRANPPVDAGNAQGESLFTFHNGQDEAVCGGMLTGKPLEEKDIPEFLRIYQNCFYSQPCTEMLTRQQAMELITQKTKAEAETNTETIAEVELETNTEATTEPEINMGAKGAQQGFLVSYMDKPVGILITAPSMYDEEALFLCALGVESRSRRKGYGKAMLQWAAAKAFKEGYKRVSLAVSSKNKKAIAMYHQSGFYRIRSGERCWYRADNHKNYVKCGKTDKK